MVFNKYTLGVDFTVKNGVVTLTADGLRKLKKPKKITGTRLSAVVGEHDFTTPFQVWCDMLGFYTSQIDPFFITAGIIVEPKVKAQVEKILKTKFTSYDPKECHYDVFRDHPSLIFGGIPDGEEFDSENKVCSILEIKTAAEDKYALTTHNNDCVVIRKDGKPIITKKGAGLQKWMCDSKLKIPKSYQYQLSLYLYLRGINTGYFCILFLHDQDYADPHKFSFDIQHNYAVEKFTLDHKEFDKVIEKAKVWHKNHIDTRESPKMSSEDLKWFQTGYPTVT